jgi:hypothetical protein
MSLADVVFLTIGTPSNPAGELILYTICAEVLLVVMKEVIGVFHALVKGICHIP